MSLNKDRVVPKREHRLTHKQRQHLRIDNLIKLGHRATEGDIEAQNILRDQFKDLKIGESEPDEWNDVAAVIYDSIKRELGEAIYESESEEESEEEELDEDDYDEFRRDK